MECQGPHVLTAVRRTGRRMGRVGKQLQIGEEKGKRLRGEEREGVEEPEREDKEEREGRRGMGIMDPCFCSAVSNPLQPHGLRPASLLRP